ncbi:MAG: hypothetical protein GF370_03385 [Candidatus Nealsonbacteria bacterium]|nr:hypothetical protein [Candidatus Nealsonbacteria bacterium]
MVLEYSKESAKKFLLSHQLLFPPRKIEGKRGIQKVFQHLRALQYDPQNPCGRNIDILLQARVKYIHPNDYYYWLYNKRRGIEVYDKELSVVPIEDIAFCRGRFPPSRRRKLNSFLVKNKSRLGKLIKLIRKEGPLCSSDIKENQKVDIFWESANWSRVALDSLWRAGKLVISHRENGRKYYDLPSKVYGSKLSSLQKDKDGLKKETVLRRIQAVGMLPISGTGSGWKGVGTGKEITPLLSGLIRAGELVEVKVKGTEKHYIAKKKSIELLSKLKNKDPAPQMSFLPPLDNLLWDREMIEEIFGFSYTWGAYKPKKDREYGHYVLPILFGSDFIGRIELRLDKEKNVLEIIGFWIEKGKSWDKKTKNAFFNYLDDFMKYLQAEKIKWICHCPI